MPLAWPHLSLLMASSRCAATTNNPTVNALCCFPTIASNGPFNRMFGEKNKGIDDGGF